MDAFGSTNRTLPAHKSQRWPRLVFLQHWPPLYAGLLANLFTSLQSPWLYGLGSDWSQDQQAHPQHSRPSEGCYLGGARSRRKGHVRKRMQLIWLLPWDGLRCWRWLHKKYNMYIELFSNKVLGIYLSNFCFHCLCCFFSSVGSTAMHCIAYILSTLVNI